ncbi:uncharacterized protein LOC106704956 [Latimeria chalumnae]|uniref:uncharacterized protein LOC106704956 n=1 Tax=Latimeria chalumnae TaxID=7897 RepID=UPI0006D8EE8F|nr:PREDICTED: uncharacterized protein LOC106704956 [Latimeria chalumnae]|eukprot:XP_014348610.1 PREDICTED: uncharacterized protein LOC106704956 [Latimeria chalumnae]
MPCYPPAFMGWFNGLFFFLFLSQMVYASTEKGVKVTSVISNSDKDTSVVNNTDIRSLLKLLGEKLHISKENQGSLSHAKLGKQQEVVKYTMNGQKRAKVHLRAKKQIDTEQDGIHNGKLIGKAHFVTGDLNTHILRKMNTLIQHSLWHTRQFKYNNKEGTKDDNIYNSVFDSLPTKDKNEGKFKSKTNITVNVFVGNSERQFTVLNQGNSKKLLKGNQTIATFSIGGKNQLPNFTGFKEHKRENMCTSRNSCKDKEQWNDKTSKTENNFVKTENPEVNNVLSNRRIQLSQTAIHSEKQRNKTPSEILQDIIDSLQAKLPLKILQPSEENGKDVLLHGDVAAVNEKTRSKASRRGAVLPVTPTASGNVELKTSAFLRTGKQKSISQNESIAEIKKEIFTFFAGFIFIAFGIVAIVSSLLLKNGRNSPSISINESRKYAKELDLTKKKSVAIETDSSEDLKKTSKEKLKAKTDRSNEPPTYQAYWVRTANEFDIQPEAPAPPPYHFSDYDYQVYLRNITTTPLQPREQSSWFRASSSHISHCSNIAYGTGIRSCSCSAFSCRKEDILRKKAIMLSRGQKPLRHGSRKRDQSHSLYHRRVETARSSVQHAKARRRQKFRYLEPQYISPNSNSGTHAGSHYSFSGSYNADESSDHTSVSSHSIRQVYSVTPYHSLNCYCYQCRMRTWRSPADFSDSPSHGMNYLPPSF